MTMRVPTNLTLPKQLVEELDAIAGKGNRSAFVEEAIRHRLRREKLRRAWEGARGAWADHSAFPTSESVVEWVRARRAERTDPGPVQDR